MFIVNGQKAKLRQFNRNKNDEIFDDRQYKDIYIKCCPYNAEQMIRFGIYTVPEAIGYYQVPRWVDVREGDQIFFIGNYKERKITDKEAHTILKVQDEWYFNRVENYIIAVK